MNKSGVLTTNEERENINWREYQYPKETGSFTGILQHRIWDRKNPCLVCLFETDNGEKIALRAWQKNVSGVEYSPKKSTTNFDEDVRDGSKWICHWEMSKSGFADWKIAEEAID